MLINKWANRKKLSQIAAYDLRSAEEKADISAMPGIPELADLSDGLTKATKIDQEYGLTTKVTVLHDARVSMTSMQEVHGATMNRPVAKVSSQILILYPTWFGICLHQHHEKPCQRYSACTPCDNHYYVKGDEFTNQHVRERKALLFGSILRQLESLVLAHNRGISDEPEALGKHLLALVERGLDIRRMADWMIAEFHDIKGMIQDKRLANNLHESFIMKGVVGYLDDDKVENGAIIKYHIPSCHESPAMERCFEICGGRDQIALKEQQLAERHSEFGIRPLPKALEEYDVALYRDDDDQEEAS